MRTHKPVWFVVLGSTSIGIAMLVGACSHDPIQPAPVLMMGRSGTTNAAVAAVVPAPAATPTSWRIAGPAPAPIAQHPTVSPHVSSRPAAARKQSSFAEKARGHRIASHGPARHRSSKVYSAAAPNASSTGTTRSPADSIRWMSNQQLPPRGRPCQLQRRLPQGRPVSLGYHQRLQMSQSRRFARRRINARDPVPQSALTSAGFCVAKWPASSRNTAGVDLPSATPASARPAHPGIGVSRHDHPADKLVTRARS